MEKAKTDKWAKERVDAYFYRSKEELYDLENDPHSLKNLVDSAEHKDSLIKLRQELKNYCEEIKDQEALAVFPK